MIKSSLQGQTAQADTLAMSLTVTLGKFFNLSIPLHPIYKMEGLLVPIS